MQNPVVIKGNKAGMTVYLGSGPSLYRAFGGGKKEIQGDGPVLGLCPDDPDPGGKEAVAGGGNFLWSTPSQKIPGSRSCASSTRMRTDPQVREGVK